MWYRFIGPAILIFWAVMTFLLVRTVYFPEFNRLPKVDPRHVLDLFFDHEEVTELFVYRDDEVVGNIMLTSRDGGRDDGSVKLAFTAGGAIEMPHLPRQRLHWRGWLNIGPAPERKIKGLDLRVRFTEPALTAALRIDPATLGFEYEISQDGQVVSSSKDPQAQLQVVQMKMMLAAWNIDLDAKAKQPPKWEARQGYVEISGHRTGAYFVVMEIPGSGTTKMTFTEAGEMIAVETSLGYELLSAVMRKPPEELPY